MTSLDKVRESIDEVVAHVMLAHADQLRNEVSERIRVFLDEDAKQLSDMEQQLRERTEQAQSLDQQLTQTRGEIADKQKFIESIEQQMRDLQAQGEQQRARIGELENAQKSDTERLAKQTKDLEQLLDLSQQEVQQLRQREEEQKNQLKQFEAKIEGINAEHQKALEAKEREKVEAINQNQRESDERLQGKERELLDQVHLLEELLVQGQHAREQQLEAKDRELQEALEKQKTEFERRARELQEQLASAPKEEEYRNRESELRREFDESKRQWQQRETELTEQRAHLEAKNVEVLTRKSELEGMQGLWEQREKELTAQLGDFEKRLADYVTAEQSWQQREQELLGHRDQVLSSSAEASQASQKALQTAFDDKGRLQEQLDALLEELAHLREELQRTQDAHHKREQSLSEEISGLRSQVAERDGNAASRVVVATPPETADEHAADDDSAAIQTAIERVHAVRSQTDILKALLEGAARFAGRSGIFVVHGRTATGWAGRGFGSDTEFRRLSVECSGGLAGRVVQGKTHLVGQAEEFDEKLVQYFGAPKDGHANIFPLIIRDRVAAFFYADCGSHVTRDVAIASIDAVVRAAGAWLDELAANKSAVAPQPASPSPTPMAAAPVVARAAAPKAAAAAATAVASEAPATDGTDAARQRARRFAKLLVDEIKLYNKDAVEQGRRHQDLYDRLRESIDKSRASYDKRWGKTITDVDYFREELVRNLAENNPAVLGSSFPR